jgi:hypothetical protein
VNPVVLVSYFDRALAWPALYGAVVLVVVLSLLVAATTVALFAENEARADRAFKIFSELLRFFRWWSR